MVRRLLPLVLAPLAGCALTPSKLPPARPVEVDVPVAVPIYCAAPPSQYPELPIGALRSTTPPADTIRAYAATVVVLKGLVRERDAIIAGCVAPKTDDEKSHRNVETAPNMGSTASLANLSKKKEPKQ